jgi:hypothetical protein
MSASPLLASAGGISVTRRSVRRHSQYIPVTGAVMQVFYSELGVDVPKDCESLLMQTFVVKFDKAAPRWQMPSDLAEKFGAQSIIVHTIACTAWSCNSAVALILEGSKDDNRDKMNDASVVYASVNPGGVIPCTEFFWPGSDSHASKVLLHRKRHTGELMEKFDISLADVKVLLRNNEVKAKTKAFISVDSKLGKVLFLTYQDFAERGECGKLVTESIKEDVYYVIKHHVRNPELGNMTGEEFIQSVRNDIRGVSPIHLNKFALNAHDANNSPDWCLWTRIVIVYRLAN